jgi:hypothetical protein
MKNVCFHCYFFVKLFYKGKSHQKKETISLFYVTLAMFISLGDGKNHTDRRVRENPDLFTEETTRKFMGSNFEELVIEGYEKLLS